MKHNFNCNEVVEQGEQLDYETLMTVPDDSLTVNEILQRFRQGMPLDHLSHQIYFEETEEIDPTQSPDYDISDAYQEMQEITDRAISKRAALAKKTSANRKAKPEEKGGSEADDQIPKGGDKDETEV